MTITENNTSTSSLGGAVKGFNFFMRILKIVFKSLIHDVIFTLFTIMYTKCIPLRGVKVIYNCWAPSAVVMDYREAMEVEPRYQ